MTFFKVHNLSKKYSEKYAIKDISFELEQGEFFTLIGPSGAGKTTLLRLIDLLEPPTSGEIEYNGWSLNSLTKKQKVTARREMGFVFQNPICFNATVKANVEYGLTLRGLTQYEINEKVSRAINMVGLLGFEERKARTLSGGEIQRVALARTLATEPNLLLLDEATANLDPSNVALIENAIQKINREKGVTVIMATHNFFQAKRLGDSVGFMLDGGMVEIGTAGQIFNNPSDKRTEAFISGEMIY